MSMTTNTSMNVILCGSNWTGCKALSLLLEMRQHRPELQLFVYTHETQPHHFANLTEYCKKKQVEFSTENISRAELPFRPDIIASIYYNYIIKNHIIDSARLGIFNLHGGLLPDYRGCSSQTWALVNNATTTGFTYHYINEKIDEGNIIVQRHMPVEEFDTQATLYNRVMFEAMKEFPNVLNLVEQGFEGTAQNPNEGNYYRRGVPNQGEIMSSWSDEEVERFIRAMNHAPYPPARFRDQEVFTMSKYLELKQI